MTESDLAEGMRIALKVAYKLRDLLGRRPRAAEIRWRLASELQRRWTRMDRRSAMTMADQMMNAVATAARASSP